MKLIFVAILSLFLTVASASDTATVNVYFSPAGGCTEAVVSVLASAHKSVYVQAYSFTSSPIAKALVEAGKRGVSSLSYCGQWNALHR